MTPPVWTSGLGVWCLALAIWFALWWTWGAVAARRKALRHRRLDAARSSWVPAAPRTVDFNSSHQVAIDRAYKWDPDMSQCPRGVKVQLLGAGGVPAYALYDGKDPFWVKWAPLPSN